MVKVTFDFDASENTNYPVIPSKAAYSKAYQDAVAHKSISYDEIYADAAKAHLSWYIAYADSILKGKIYRDEHLVPQLFISGNIAPGQEKEYLKTNLFAAKDYCQYLVSTIKPETVRRYDHTLRSLDVDLERLLVLYEVYIQKSANHVGQSSWRKPVLSPDDIFSAAKELFYIEERDSIEELYLRDLKPVVMFQIRQLLEIFGRQIIGYADIVDVNGNPVKKFSQIAWDFIADECNQTPSRIELPFSVSFMKMLNTWSNNFVHTSYIHSAYIQYYALHILSLLFKGSGNPVRIHDGKMQRKRLADIKINRYDELKASFESFLQDKKPDITVNWLPLNLVQAYIVSL